MLLLLLSRVGRVQLCATHRRQSTRLPRPWDSPGKNTGVGCHFLLQCMKVKSESEVAQPCLTPRYRMDCSLPGSSVHGISKARVLEWGAIAFSEYEVYSSEYFLYSMRYESNFIFFKEQPTLFSEKNNKKKKTKNTLSCGLHLKF